MDVKINCNEGRFKFRVCGILQVDGKILCAKMNQNKFYCFPGGHVELGEFTQNAVVREMKEETGYDVEIENLAVVHQNLFMNEGFIFHELAFYYFVKPIEKVEPVNKIVHEFDKDKEVDIEFTWFSKQEFADATFFPCDIKDAIVNPNKHTQFITTKEY